MSAKESARNFNSMLQINWILQHWKPRMLAQHFNQGRLALALSSIA